MPNTIIMIKRILIILILFLFIWLISVSVQNEDAKKYKAKHDYSNIYKNKQNKVETPNEKKAFMFRGQGDPKNRHDLKPKLVYRGTHEEIDPNDMGLVRNPEDKKILDDGYKNFAYNTLVSSRLGFFRDINDTRHKHCLGKSFPESLPNVSVIMCFYNEDFYTLMRSVFSVVRRTPSHLLKEIFLINDNSEDKDIIQRIQNEVDQNLELSMVKFVTPEKRLGLIRARIFGARQCTGDVLVFLDSHIEANVDWLQPLLVRIKEPRTNVVTPIIDVINPDTLSYSPSPLVRGGFNWGMHFKWESLHYRVKQFDEVTTTEELNISQIYS